MPELMELEVATPERELVREEVESAQVPGKEGYLGILPGHAPLLGQLGTGFLSYTVGGRPRYLAVAGGFLEVLPERVRVLADVAEKADEIDVERAQRALDRAQAEQVNPSAGADPAVALAAEARARARLEVAQRK